MAQLQTVFDATKFDPSQGIGQLPVGNKLPVVITESEMKPTKDNSGGYLQFTVQIGQGEHAGRRGAYRINLYNASDAARSSAERQLSALCHVTGVFTLENTQQLHNIPFLIDVVPQADPKYTEVKAVYDANGNEPGKAHQQQNTQQNNNHAQNNQQGAWGQNNAQNNTQQNTQQQTTNQPAWGGAQNQQQEQQPMPQQQQNNSGWQQNNGGGSQPAWATNK